MTENSTTKNGGSDNGSASAVVALDSPDEHDGLSEDLPEHDGLSEDLPELDDDDPDQDGSGSGAVSGGFGLAGLALAVVALTTSWTSSVVISHSQYSQEMNAPSSGMTAQQQLNMYASGWHTQGWWALAFAAVAVLFGAGVLLSPRLLRSRRIPGWAKATATGAIIVGLVGVLLAVLTLVGVFGGHLTAPAS